jgi:hypothetical protein
MENPVGLPRWRLLVARVRRQALSLAALLLASVLIGLAVSRFRFVFDDYAFLLRATTEPWYRDESMRFLSTNVLFFIGTRFSAPEPFFASTTVALALATALIWARLLRRVGFCTGEALLAAALLLLGPGVFELVQRASGAEQLGALGAVLGVLHAFDRSLACGEREGAQRRAWLAASLGLTVLAVFVKLAAALVIPIAVFVWGRLVRRDSSSSFLWHAVSIAIPAYLLYPMGTGLGDFGQVSALAVPSNLAAAFRLVGPYMGLAAVAWTAGAALGMVDHGPRHMLAGAARSVFQRVGSASGLAWAVALGGAFLAPYLFHAGSFPHYYALAAWAPIGALTARVLHGAWRTSAQPLAAVPFMLLMLTPWQELSRLMQDDASHRLEGFLQQVGDAARGHTRPTRIVFHASCDTPAATADSAAELTELLAFAQGSKGIAWATGFRYFELTQSRSGEENRMPGDLWFSYCSQRGVRLYELERAGAP